MSNCCNTFPRSPEVEWQAQNFRVFSRAPNLQTPRPLLQVVLLDGRLDESLREMAGNVTLLYGQAIAERLAVCRPRV